MNGQTDTDTAAMTMTGADMAPEVERFAEIGRLSAVLLHEINNPLTAALLWLEQCKDPGSPHLPNVRRSIRTLQRYVEAARQQIRRESRCRRFHLQAELDQVRCVLSALAIQRGVSLHFAEAGGIRLHGDPVKFQHIIANLVRNAIDSYDGCPAGHKPVSLSIRTEPDYLIVEVHDMGCGIDEDQLDRLFEPFYSTKSTDGGGLGIGLFAAKRSIEEDFGGSISVASGKGQGTRFTARLKSEKDYSGGRSPCYNH